MKNQAQTTIDPEGSAAQPGITFKTAPHGAKLYEPNIRPASTSMNLLELACLKEHGKCKELVQPSYQPTKDNLTYPSSNGFVRSAIEAYNQHHRSIRPDDV